MPWFGGQAVMFASHGTARAARIRVRTNLRRPARQRSGFSEALSWLRAPSTRQAQPIRPLSGPDCSAPRQCFVVLWVFSAGIVSCIVYGSIGSLHVVCLQVPISFSKFLHFVALTGQQLKDMCCHCGRDRLNAQAACYSCHLCPILAHTSVTPADQAKVWNSIAVGEAQPVGPVPILLSILLSISLLYFSCVVENLLPIQLSAQSQWLTKISQCPYHPTRIGISISTNCFGEAAKGSSLPLCASATRCVMYLQHSSLMQ